MRLAWDGSRTRSQLLRGALVLYEVVLALLIAHPTSLSAESPAGSADRFPSDSPQSTEEPVQSQVLSRSAPWSLPNIPTPAQIPAPTMAATQPAPTSSPTSAPSPQSPSPAYQTGRPTAAPTIPQRGPAATPTPISPPPTPLLFLPVPTKACEQQLIAVVSQFRIDNGVPPLLHKPLLSAAAQQYADIVASHSILSHTADGRTLDARVEAAGYRDWIALGENIAGGYATAEEALKGWLASAPHRHNLLNPAFMETGVGCAWNPDSPYGYFWVQEFAAR